MSWVGIVLIGVICMNIVFFGVLFIVYLLDDDRRRHNESKRIDR